MSVTAIHPQYGKFSAKWQQTKDVVDGNVGRFLRDIDPTGHDIDRNILFRENAVLVNFTDRTKQGLTGAAFSKPPQASLPPALEYLLKDATGDNLSLDQLAQAIVGDILETGRDGLLVDFPKTDILMPTQADVEALDGKARIYKYEASAIINWQTERIGSKTMLTLVVLKEHTSKLGADGFTWIEEIRYRVLRLVKTNTTLTYTQQLFNEHTEAISELMVPERDGKAWDEIPFVFVGSENNDARVDKGPLADLARLSVQHYRNSALYEESIFIVGQPTLFFTTSHNTHDLAEALPKGITTGSRGGFNLGTEGNAWLLQPMPNQLAEVAMANKEKQAISLGARIITPTAPSNTATEALIRHGSEVSVLSTIVHNVSNALQKAIMFAGDFMRADTSTMKYELNDIFFDDRGDPNEIMASIQLWNSGITARVDAVDFARDRGYVSQDRTIEQIDADIVTDPPIATFNQEQETENLQDLEE